MISYEQLTGESLKKKLSYKELTGEDLPNSHGSSIPPSRLFDQDPNAFGNMFVRPSLSDIQAQIRGENEVGRAEAQAGMRSLVADQSQPPRYPDATNVGLNVRPRQMPAGIAIPDENARIGQRPTTIPERLGALGTGALEGFVGDQPSDQSIFGQFAQSGRRAAPEAASAGEFLGQNVLAPIATYAGIGGAAARPALGYGGSFLRGALAGGATEGAQQAFRGEFDPQAIAENAALFAAGDVAAKGVGTLIKRQLRPVLDQDMPKLRDQVAARQAPQRAGMEAVRTQNRATVPEKSIPPKFRAPSAPLRPNNELKTSPQTIEPVSQQPVVPQKAIEKPPVAAIDNEPKTNVAETPQGRNVDSEAVGLNKAEIERIRGEFELDKLDPAKRKSVETSLSQAKAQKLDESALDTAEELLRSSRPISDAEHAGMALKATKLADEYAEARKDVAALLEKGDDISAAQARSDVILDQLDRLTEASERAGTEIGRGLNIRKMMVNRESYDLAHVLQEARASKRAKLTPEEAASFEAQTTKIKELESTVKRMEIEHGAKLAEQERLLAERIAQREIVRGRIRSKAAGSREKLRAEREDIKKQMRELGYQVNIGVDPRGAYLAGRMAINYLHEGAVNLNEAVKMVLADFPELTKEDVWRAMNMKDPSRQAAARSETTKKVVRAKSIANLLSKFDIESKGTNQKVIGRTLRDLRSAAYASDHLDSGQLERAVKKINELQDQLKNTPLNETEWASARQKMQDIKTAMRTEDALADLNKQLSIGEFKTRPKTVERPLPRELDERKVELGIARKKVRETIRELRPRNPVVKAISEGYEVARTTGTTADTSRLFRQNVVLTFNHPINAAKQFGKAIKPTFSEFDAQKLDYQLRNSPNSYYYKKFGVAVQDMDGALSERSEFFQSKLAERLPVIGHVFRASNRNMVTLGNLVRTSLFDDFLMKFPNATSEELKLYANYLNKGSGLGDLSYVGKLGTALSKVFFSPKLAVSRFQTPIALAKMWQASPRLRKQAIREIVGFVSTGTTVLTLAKMNGLEVGYDPREADFGKIRDGNTRFDIFGGFQQPARLIARIGMVGTDRAGLTGKGIPENEKDIDPVELMGRFAIYKFHPTINLGLTWFTGKNPATGENTGALDATANSLIPYIAQDIRDAYKLNEQSVGHGAAAGAASFVGIGASTYKDSESRTRRDIRKEADSGNQVGAEQKRQEWNKENPENVISSKATRDAQQREYDKKVKDSHDDLTTKVKAAYEKGAPPDDLKQQVLDHNKKYPKNKVSLKKPKAVKIGSIDSIDREQIPRSLMVNVKAIRMSTGEEFTMRQNAREALDEIEERLRKYEQLAEYV